MVQFRKQALLLTVATICNISAEEIDASPTESPTPDVIILTTMSPTPQDVITNPPTQDVVIITTMSLTEVKEVSCAKYEVVCDINIQALGVNCATNTCTECSRELQDGGINCATPTLITKLSTQSPGTSTTERPNSKPTDEPIKTPKAPHHQQHDDPSSSSSSSSTTKIIVEENLSSVSSPKKLLATSIVVGLVRIHAMVVVFIQ